MSVMNSDKLRDFRSRNSSQSSTLARRVHARGRDAPLAIAALFAILAVGLHSLGDFELEMPANVFLLLTLVGIGLAPRA